LSRNPEPILEASGVVKRFYYYAHRTSTLREWFIRTVLGQPLDVKGREFVLRGFDLRVERGETVGLIGPNGSGKSTALRLLAGIYVPNEGSVVVNGRVTAVIELGAGFHEDLTGAENMHLYGSVMGMTPAEMAEKSAGIVEFAGLADFIDTPVRYYSSGMQARLAFAVAMSVRPDVILLDEVTAVGDESFKERCRIALQEFRDSGGTIIVASHDLESVRALCDRVVWMERGTIRSVGPAADVVDRYWAEVAGELAGVAG
jgi:ABC-type polysaccharide/polyol phosphate transport system ATPase subunit